MHAGDVQRVKGTSSQRQLKIRYCWQAVQHMHAGRDCNLRVGVRLVAAVRQAMKCDFLPMCAIQSRLASCAAVRLFRDQLCLCPRTERSRTPSGCGFMCSWRRAGKKNYILIRRNVQRKPVVAFALDMHLLGPASSFPCPHVIRAE